MVEGPWPVRPHRRSLLPAQPAHLEHQPQLGDCQLRLDLNGHHATVVYPAGAGVNPVTSTRDTASRSMSYTLDPDGRPNTVSNVNVTSAASTYDNDRRLTVLWNKQGATTITKHTYTLDARGDRTQNVEVIAPAGGGGTAATTYAYANDELSRLTSAGPSGSPTSYTYDPAGNRLTKGGTSSTHDRADHRITGVGGTSYTVNANGNLTGRGTDTFGYDQANRLTGRRSAGRAAATRTTATAGGPARPSAAPRPATPTTSSGRCRRC